MNKPTIVGITGNAGCGKDTAANHLVNKYGFVRVSLADPIKRFAQDVFDFSDDQLWGPSEQRNAIDPYTKGPRFWEGAERIMEDHDVGAEFIEELLPSSSGWGDKQQQALDSLHEWLCGLHGKYGVAGISPRIVLQTLGTEWGRAQDGEIWTSAAINTAKKLTAGGALYDSWGLYEAPMQPPTSVVISDVRFKNELRAIKDAGGLVIRICRQTAVNAMTLGVKGHASEAEQSTIPDSDFDAVIHAVDGVQLFYQQLDSTLPSLLGVEKING